MPTIQQFDYSVNVLQAVLWQYDESPNLLGLLNRKQTWYTTYQTDFWSSWYTNVFNLQTANLFGLSVWSFILNAQLYVPYNPEPDSAPIWGFNDNSLYPTLENTYTNFFGGNFSSLGDIITLSEAEQRFLLFLRYYQLTTRGVVGDINTYLNFLVGLLGPSIGFTGAMYALDGLDMTMTYVLTNNTFPANLLQILIEEDILPRPAGVGIKEVIIIEGVTFGFNSIPPENDYTNFGFGNFFSGFFI